MLSDYNLFDFSKLNKNFYQFDREYLLRITPLEKRLSSVTINYSQIIDQKDFLTKAIRYLTKFSYGLFKYITNESAPNIVFTFETDSSYCELTNNRIVIDVNILKDNNITYQTRVDVIIGILIHEFYHKRFTVIGLAEYLNIDHSKYYEKSNRLLVEKWFNKNLQTHTKKHILNIIEDFRIEKLGIRTFPGYGFFFDLTRQYAFFIISNNVTKFTNESILFLLLDYLMISILMPELKERKIEILHQISPIPKWLKEFDEVALKIDECIIENSELIYSDDFNEILQAVEIINKLFESYNLLDKNLSCMPEFNKGNAYLQPNTDKTFTANEENLILEIQGDVIKELEKESKIKSTDGFIEKIKNNEKYAEYDFLKIYQQKPEKVDKEILKEATKLSKDICNNLGFLNARYNRINYRHELDEGELDEEELYSISFNNNIFFTEEKVQGYELELGILLDESGSMINVMKNAKIACLTLALSLHKEKHINLYIYGHTANYLDDNTDNDIPLSLYKYYDSRSNFKNIDTIYGASAKGNNADGFAIDKMCEIMNKCKSKNKVLIVISDGMPNAFNYPDGIKHTHDIVKKYEAIGFTIIQICMANIEESPKMFSKFIPYTNHENFIINLKNILIKILNQFHNEI